MFFLSSVLYFCVFLYICLFLSVVLLWHNKYDMLFTVPEMTYNVFSGTLNPTHLTCAVLPERCASASPQSALSFKSVNICYRNWIDCGVLRCLWVSMSCWRQQRSCWSESVRCCQRRHIQMPRCRWRMPQTLCVIPSSPATPQDSFCLCRQTSPVRGTANAVSAADWWGSRGPDPHKIWLLGVFYGSYPTKILLQEI